MSGLSKVKMSAFDMKGAEHARGLITDEPTRTRSP